METKKMLEIWNTWKPSVKDIGLDTCVVGAMMDYEEMQVKNLNLANVSQQRELLTKFYRHLCEIAVIDSEYRTEHDIKTIPKKFSL